MININSSRVKEIATQLGAEKCGIADINRFGDAPEGFHPRDTYPKTASVIVFLKSMPADIIMCPNPVPYTSAAYLIYSEIVRIGLSLTRHLGEHRVGAVPVPCDTPYLRWNSETCHGQGILSMRHSGVLAGLGYLGRNTLLINRELGNMVYIGAVLADHPFEPDPVISDECPSGCSICIDSCPQSALTGKTVIQKLCRAKSLFRTERGFDLYNCSRCRQSCPRRLGYRE